ncbi:tRNA (adenosine(37)-N6)-threonylcarbamoyltransferase complex dimerization subunit type 1 TsaB [Lentilactobacillus sp. TOM.63]|uniref:tRNA (adenosine(37)-N6)-threonylcarbamoyltransferase complex dimerization subunit type 1 TsaB n=1 Tax=Lentilactobacillus TaxID=2767893 RepID=UPI001C263484|nr:MULTISPECIES: tRNA (adenosine(37)-N6)-threonylcarbamoyltransferase complex dimerization subunit type 1 TsaB [Lentilactobacillus]MBU9789633.1 tRNA (adenosine(37)-N6)-threonylcarbamoyltransferase complex dimerization subunit type 1 TsaB [Lentilactobacillus dabitei]MDM7515248.1 tRNA (adenosine(37)-N6)-threonylcarbamoyltransferase complex dimerization subunit type 1 TsaB [Lentilactobacillus sp. TOM.63]
MKILAIDTSNRPLSVAVLDDDHLLAQTTITTHRKHAEFLMPIIEDLVSKSDLKPNDLDRVVVAAGPGSYTGIRMAVTAAKTIAATLEIQLTMVSSLLTLCLNVSQPGVLVNPIFDGRNQNMFTGLYQIGDDGNPIELIEDQHINLDQWLELLEPYNQRIMIVGDTDAFEEGMRHALGDRLIVADKLADLPNAARLGLYGKQVDPVTNVDAVVPRYLRLTKAEADWKKLHPNGDTHNYVEKI